MSEHNKTTFWRLLSRQKIVIPIQQRDYAQGRRGKEYLRHRFLLELKSALDDENKSLTLDFVYGVANADNSIAPLDGQQRLTTLWLLHWYIAFRRGQLAKEEVKNVLRKFSYETRVSSREFCHQLCDLPIINDNKQSLLNHIRQQPWYFSAWKQDPTIQAMLRMLCGTETDNSENKIGDSIERLFSDSSRAELDRYWERLIINEPGNCPITFYQMAIGTTELPLSDDLYIKMNARGKALTSFENFKADLLQWMKKKISEKDSVMYGALIDNQWTDIFWDLAGKETTYCVDEVFFAFVNRYFYNLVITSKDESGSYVLTDKNAVKNDDYQYFSDAKAAYESFVHYEKYLNEDVLETIKTIFSHFMRIKDNSFFVCKWNNDFSFIPQYKTVNGEPSVTVDNAENKIYEVSSINQQERVVFYAVCKYLRQYPADGDEENGLAHWMRFVWNLVSESDGRRPAIRSIGAMQEAIGYIDMVDSHRVYGTLSRMDIVSNVSSLGKRFNEEIIKARQIYNPQNGVLSPDRFDDWEQAIVSAENEAFFHGAIRFLFTNKENKTDWSDFEVKYRNAVSSISLDVNDKRRHTVRNMIPFLRDCEIKEIFNRMSLSNDDDNLQKIFLRYPSYLHDFFMQNNVPRKDMLTLLQNDLISLCEKHPNYWIHDKWEHGMDCLSDYANRSGYYKYESYFIGTDFIQERINLLKNASGEDGRIIFPDAVGTPHKGLFIDFRYLYNSEEYKFRWHSNDWIDMYDAAGNNLWAKGLHTSYQGNETPSFHDESSLIEELNRCCDEYNKSSESEF